MKRGLIRIIIITIVLVLGGSAFAQRAEVTHFKQSVLPILSENCFTCHGDGESKGKIAFDELKTDDAVLNRELWWKVLKNVRAGIMPPFGEPRPNADQIKTLESWIKQDVFGIDPKNPDPGRVTIRRLNRVEYRNTIRDLMGIDFKTDDEFPPDDTGYGFDNIGDVLSISPMLLEKYMAAAETIASQAVPTVNKVVQEQFISGGQFMRGGGGRGGAGATLSFTTPRTVSQTLSIGQAGEYRVNVEVTINGSFDFDPDTARMIFKVDGTELFHDDYRWQNGKKYEYSNVLKWEPGQREFTIELQPTTPPPASQPADAPPPPPRFGAPPKLNIDLRLVGVRVTGPLDQALWKAPPNYTRFFPRAAPPAADPDRREYARQVISDFAAKAFRRPVDARTVDRLVAIAESVYTQPGKVFEEGIAHALVAVLASPRFLFRVEEPLAAEAQQPWAKVDEYALASRLSYFLWSTMPDDRLLDLARRGELRKNMAGEVKRMLADDRSSALVENFTGQWLEARDVDGIAINERVVLARDAGQEAQLRQDESDRRAQFAARAGRGNVAAVPPAAPAQADQQPAARSDGAQPQAAQADAPQAQQAPPQQLGRGRGRGRGRGNAAPDAPAVELNRDLRTAMRRETEMYFGYILHEDRPILELIDSNYTFLNEALAKHYGVPDVSGPQMRRVELPPDNPRGGVLTQASVLIVTSNPTRTSPVKRGLFVLDNILGVPAPPPPPDGIPQLEESEKQFADHEPTMREMMQAHRDKPLCASCHKRMDSLGLALENFNALGMWRTKERGQEIDASGQLITGEKLTGLKDLKNVLKTDRKMDFYRCLTEKFLTYALGRGLDYYDTESVDRIVEQLNQNDGRFSALLMGVIDSAPFQERRNVAPPVAQNVHIGAQP